MRAFVRAHYHRLFRGGVLIKAAIGLGELVVGSAFVLLNQASLTSLVHWFVPAAWEPALLPAIQSSLHDIFLYSNAFWAFLFLSHGLVKLVLTFGLLRSKVWAYIASLIVFSYFIVNQIYHAILNASLALELITVFDIIVVFLIFYDFRKHRRDQGSAESRT